MKKTRTVYALFFFILLITEICIALFVNDSFIRPYIGDALVTVLICCFLRVIVPEGVRALPLYTFLFAVIVETAQYFDIVRLLGLEGNTFISTVIGRTFSFTDIICYCVGCITFYLAEKIINKKMVTI